MSVTKGKAQDIDQHIGERMRFFRQLRNLTQVELAAELGITFQQLQKYETGKNRVAASRLYQVADFLNVEVQDFCQTNSKGKQAKHSFDDLAKDKESMTLLALWHKIESPEIKKSLLSLLKKYAETK